ncbi:protein of unknown function [Legionella fallonii LLAP-10]|uniref:Uncharacterized protein n=1 Tax=Legionella fallonii LLAP-10 TaxID=1212491 RepID=A0A098G577_9GAMM|nr:protein of unknown function [Legionella fallonii LLAP-10]
MVRSQVLYPAELRAQWGVDLVNFFASIFGLTEERPKWWAV